LKALYPTWRVPDDLFSPVGGTEEQALWNLYGAGNYAEIRRRIASMQAANPQWRPSSDLASKLDLGESRVRIAAASNAGSWNQVLSYASASKGLLVCANMDSMWRVSEALVKTSRLAEGFDLHRYILSNCPDPHERLATFQKASLLLPAEGMDALLPLAASVDEQASFAGIRFDQLRGRIGAVASGADDSEVSDDELRRFAQYIDQFRSAADATLFGWYLYRLEYFEDAAAWFKAASQISKDPKPLEGYILSLRNLDQADKAEEIAYKNRKRSAEIAKVYVEIVAEQLTDEDRDGTTGPLTADQFKRYQEAVDDIQSPLGSQAIGWYYVDEKDLPSAQKWFDKSVKWEQTEGGVVGQAVVAARYKRMADLQKIKSTYQAEFPALKDFNVWKSYKAKYVKKGQTTKKVVKKQQKPEKSFLAKMFDS
jgi:tetratricopeptide (TPR) repeat protein